VFKTMLRAAAIIVSTGLLFASGWLLRAQQDHSVAVVYYWKAKPGKLDAYNHYIQTVAAPIDEDARRNDAFVSVTTFVSRKPDAPWTHMRVFILKNREQASGLAAALDAAGLRVNPDESRRKANTELAASLRDFVAQEDLDILK
jgi:hypothetical protein